MFEHRTAVQRLLNDTRSQAELERDAAAFNAAMHLDKARKSGRFCPCADCVSEQARLAKIEASRPAVPRIFI